jgi:hypothetical protein
VGDHTPGPWKVREDNDGETRPSWAILQDVGPGPVAPWIARVNHPDNARLIAAAPDLLAALERIEPGLPTDTNEEYDEKMQARAAIAKAKGEA